MILRIIDVARIAAKLAALWFLLSARFPWAWAFAAWMVSELLWDAHQLIVESASGDDEESEPPAKSSPPARPHPRHVPSSRPPARG